jgi:hypothetical protein
MSSLRRSASADEKADLSSVIKKMDEALNTDHYRQRRRVYCYKKLEPRSMEARILRPLTWFTLLEYESETGTGQVERHLYRKTPLFDRFVKFDVQIERPASRH